MANRGSSFSERVLLLKNYAFNSKTIQNSLHFVLKIIVKVNLDQPKAFDRVDHAFMEDILSAARFRVNFRSWIAFFKRWNHGGGEWGKIEAFQFVKVVHCFPYFTSLRWNLSFASWGRTPSYQVLHYLVLPPRPSILLMLTMLPYL